MSTQVKIGGVRIEVEDIESNIMKTMFPKLRHVVVSRRSGKELSEPDFLVAFIVSSIDVSQEDEAAFSADLQRNLPLPRHMRPSVVKFLQDIPRTASGKLDRTEVEAIPIDWDTFPGEKNVASDLSDFEETLRGLWEEALPGNASGHTINRDTDFFHAGGNSLALINLQRLIKDHLMVEVSIHHLFQSITLEKMSRLIHQKQHLRDRSAPNDWKNETRISAALTELAVSTSNLPPKAIPQTVVLTGATGFLGQEILQQLIDDERVTRVICIAVRTPQRELGGIFRDGKVDIRHGNLGARQLGLSDHDSRQIFNDVDTVIHAAADVSFMKTYESLRLTNVASTKELVRLCLPRRIPLHFISSATIAQLSGREAFGPESVADFAPLDGLTDGYTAAKWVSEVYLERISRQLGLPVTIHRPTSITGEAAPESDLVSSLMRYVRRLKAVPDVNKTWSGYLDFVSVQAAAGQIIGHVKSSQDRAAAGAKFV
ncbi:hypothetical protein SLS63_014192 [Diaporthe eres]|uniref:Carrier domain-containing protein n=1 Tax=Diaporthe eres TaxID=83184 RepID=A0ABR1NKI0_DIAER